VGSLGSFGLSAFDAKDEWRLSSPDEIRAETTTGGELIFTVTRQKLFPGDAQMMVLKNSKPFHPYGLSLRGLENIAEEPWPRHARQIRDIVIIPHENSLPQRNAETQNSIVAKSANASMSGKTTTSLDVKSSAKPGESNLRDTSQTKAPHGLGFLMLACLISLFISIWLVARSRIAR